MKVRKEVSIGHLVKSIAGRDKGQFYVVVGVDGRNVLLVDGFKRKLENPKKKNILHIQLTRVVDPDISSKLRAGFRVTNEEIYNFVSKQKKKEG